MSDSKEYPKVIWTGGIKVTVESAVEEARWTERPEPEVVVEPEPTQEAPPAPLNVETAKPKKEPKPKKAK